MTTTLDIRAQDGRPAGWFNPWQGAIYQREARGYPHGVIVEVGSWLGRSLSFIAPHVRGLQQTVWCVDTWHGSEADETGALAAGFDVFAGFRQNVKRMGIADLVHPLRMPSVDAAQRFDDRSVDLVMIDADHRYESVKADIDAWVPKLKPGGTLMGHDFDPDKWPGVVAAVTLRWPRVQHEHRVWMVRHG